MRQPDADTLMFFDAHRDALDLYRELETLLYDLFPLVNKRVQKTQITFFNRHVFACVSFARVKRKAEQPEGSLVLTLGLPGPLDSERVAVKTEPYPGRWTHHIILRRPEELDGRLVPEAALAYDQPLARIISATVRAVSDVDGTSQRRYVGLVPVQTEFVHVAMHIVKTKRVWRVTPAERGAIFRSSHRIGILVCAGIGLVETPTPRNNGRVSRSRRLLVYVWRTVTPFVFAMARARGKLPLRLGRQVEVKLRTVTQDAKV